MNINISYDASANAAPSWFKSAVSFAVGQMDALIADPITLNLTFSWGQENNIPIRAGAAAQNQSYGGYVNYATLYGALSSHATSAYDHTALATLTATDPTHGGQYYVPTAMMKALGLLNATSTAPDGFVGLDSSLNWSPSANGQVGLGQYDPVVCIEHELSEILGRVGYLSNSQRPNVYGPMDLFRYTAPGQRDLTPGTGSFSIDGQTLQKTFNNPILGGDAADWAAGTTGDVFGNITAGVASNFSAADLQLLDVLGYTIGTVPTQNTSAVATPPAPAPATNTVPAPTAKRQHVTVAQGDTVQAPKSAMLDGSSGGRTFVFRPDPGQTTVTEFHVAGAQHDTLSFSSSSFSSIADILRHTHQVGSSAVVLLDDSDKVVLQHTTVADLRQHRSDFKLHA